MRQAGIQTFRQQHIPVTQLGHLEPLGKDPDDSHWLLIQGHGSAKDLGIAAKDLLPESVGDENHRRRAGEVVLGSKISPEVRGDPERP